jgi:hypothetical protein
MMIKVLPIHNHDHYTPAVYSCILAVPKSEHVTEQVRVSRDKYGNKYETGHLNSGTEAVGSKIMELLLTRKRNRNKSFKRL